MERQRVDSSLRLDPTSFILHRLAAAEGRAGRWDSNRQSLIPNPQSLSPRHGYTLVELLMATALSLMVMFGVVTVFGMIGQGVNDSRATLEMSEALRSVAAILRNDLAGVTVTMDPPRRPESGEGVFEYTEGPIGPIIQYSNRYASNNDVADLSDPRSYDTMVGDIDDKLMFTTRSRTEPFVGRYAGRAVESYDAEIAYFVRGRTLYRRVLLIAPALSMSGMNLAGFYAANDISVRVEGGGLVANTLADLTKPENRYAHRPMHENAANDFRSGLPYHPDFFRTFRSQETVPIVPSYWATQRVPPYVGLGLPTLAETSAGAWGSWVPAGDLPARTIPSSLAFPFPLTANGVFDARRNPHPWNQLDPDTGSLTAFAGPRVGEDVILNNVIGFDVKAWDPGAQVLEARDTKGTPSPLDDEMLALLPGDPGYNYALGRFLASQPFNETNNNIRYAVVSQGAYVDLNYRCPLGGTGSQFAGAGDPRSGVRGTEPGQLAGARSAVYDTWSTHYEAGGPGANGFDDPPFGGGPLDGVVDDPGEMQCPPPYAVPLRGIQVKIRCYEPSSRQIREVTVVQEFVTK